jgi:hypothetical protein
MLPPILSSTYYIPILRFIGHFETLWKRMPKVVGTVGAGTILAGQVGDDTAMNLCSQTSSDVKRATSNVTNYSWGSLANYYTPEIEHAVDGNYAADNTILELNLARKRIVVERTVN